MRSHIAEATAEMCRPYPLGSFTSGPGAPPDLRGSSLPSTISALNTNFWNTCRLSTENQSTCNTTATTTSVQGNFLERVRLALESDFDYDTLTMEFPMMLQDLLAGYYIRRLQTQVAPHTCNIGYCKQNWSDPCRFGLPVTDVRPHTGTCSICNVPRRTYQ